DRNNNTTQYYYDNLKRLIEIKDAEDNRVRTTYDDVGNIASSIDQRGNETRYTYDEKNRLVLTTNALGGETRYSYDRVGNILSTTDELGRETTYKYDALNRLIHVMDPLSHNTYYKYDEFGNLTQVAGELGRVINYSYDNLNRQTQVTDAYGHTIHTHYDEVGNIVSVTDKLGHITSYAYDGRNWLTHSTNALGNSTTYGYDKVGNLTSFTDALGHQTRYEYDELYRPIETTDPLGQATTTTYDNEGNLRSLTDALDNTTNYTYNNINQLVTETITVDGTEFARTYDYDATGNLIERIDRNRRKQTFTYDALNRLEKEQWLNDNNNSVRTISYDYDVASQLRKISDPDAVYIYDYDLAGRLVEAKNNILDVPSVIFDYEYNAANNLTSVTDHINTVQGGIETFSYDLLNRVTQLTQSGNGVTNKQVAVAYDANSQITRLTRYSDLAGTKAVAETTYQYDIASRLTDLTHKRGSSILADYEFTYDAVDRLTKLVTPDGISIYNYNNRGELTDADYDYQENEVYTYDATGNRANHIAGDHNRLLSDDTYIYKYDNEGNRIHRIDIVTGEVTAYTWDHRNRLTTVVKAARDGTVLKESAYTYDAYNRRIARIIDLDGSGAEIPTEEYFVYDGDHIALVFDGDGNQTQRYLHGPEIDQILAEESIDGETIWLLVDHQGSVRDIIDNQGAILNHITYNSYGNITSETNPEIEQRFGYTGRESDKEVGLMYYRARYFDPAVGTFVSEDPLGFDAGDANVYRYVSNQPLTFIDPYGTIQWGTVARESTKAAAAGLTVVAGTTALVTSGLVSAPVVLTAGGVLLTAHSVNSYNNRRLEALRADVSNRHGRISLATVGDTFGLSGLYEGTVGRSIVTGCILSESEQSKRLGQAIGSLVTIAGASRAKGLGSALGRRTAISVPGWPPKDIGRGLNTITSPISSKNTTTSPNSNSNATSMYELARLGVDASRVRAGSNGKVALIGRGMDQIKFKHATLRMKGYDVEIFDKQIPRRTLAKFKATAKAGANASQLKKLDLFELNRQWALNVKKQGYTVIDTGDPLNRFKETGFSVYYALEKSILFP
ncbi:MAG: RHS repeat protein, partial [Leptolyngbya sp. SIO3F4]|nr:RHS repeat protein [Leptolyngbya sp. SIO3F4]